jgi:HEAT repeat protein
MIQDCLLLMKSGDTEELFEIIPRLGVLRDKRFHEPLLESLNQTKDAKRREFAAYAMGSIADREFLDPLKKVFLETCSRKVGGARDLQVAVIEAIGALGDDAAAEFFLPILTGDEPGRETTRLCKWILDSLGAIAQQGGIRSLEVLLKLTHHRNPELRAHSLSELAVAYWHRPNDIEDATLKRIIDLVRDRSPIVAESALAALQSLADVGCRRAERFFADR